MNKELIMYIAYKTTEPNLGKSKNNFGQFGRARNFISTVFFLNIIETILIFNLIFFHRRINMTIGLYMTCMLSILIIHFFIGHIFTKKVLAKSIKLYKESYYAYKGKSIGMTYFIINLIFIVILVFLMDSFM